MTQQAVQETQQTQKKPVDKYYRTGVAVPVERRPVLDARLQSLGLKTVGDLVTLFILGSGIVEALLPIAEKLKSEGKSGKGTNARRKEVAEKLKALSPEELEVLMSIAMKQTSTPAAS